MANKKTKITEEDKDEIIRELIKKEEYKKGKIDKIMCIIIMFILAIIITIIPYPEDFELGNFTKFCSLTGIFITIFLLTYIYFEEYSSFEKFKQFEHDNC
jgi:heme/copper-type cytochrome/quinol oxidase subunit 4